MMTPQEIEQLFNDNVIELNKLNIASGSMIKGLIQGLESNGPTYLRLFNAISDGHKIHYTLLSGDTSLIKLVGDAFGLTITEDSIEVGHA